MKTWFQEMMEEKKEASFDDSTIELFRQYLQEAVLRKVSRPTPLLGWSDN